MKIKPNSSKLIYYPAGLISLIFLPILCIWYLYQNKAFEKFVALEITWWAPNLQLYNPHIYPRENHPNKYYMEINLTGNDLEDKEKLEDAQLKIRNLVRTQDTSTVIHFHFNDTANYWTLIKAIDICFIENATHFFPYGNDIWVSIPKTTKSRNEISVNCYTNGGCISNDLVFDKSEDQVKKERKEKIMRVSDTIKTFFVSELLFGIMIFLTIKRTYLNLKAD